jgi:hypothetical protein
MFSFVGIKFCLQLVVLVVHRLHDNVYNFKREKTMFAITIIILRKHGYNYIFDHGPSQKF